MASLHGLGWPCWPEAQPLPLPSALPAAAAAGAPGTRPGCRPRARSGFQEAGGEAFQPSLAVAAAAPREPSRPAAAPLPRCPAAPLVLAFPATGGSSGGRRAGTDRPAAGRDAHLRDRRRRWRRAPSASGPGPALRSARPEGRDRRGGRVPAPFNFGGGAGWRPASGTIGIPRCARGVAELVLLISVSASRDAAAAPGWEKGHPRRSRDRSLLGW